MALKNTPAINGPGNRKSESWIESFVDYTDNLESAPIFRKWVAISTLAAVMERKTWITTSDKFYPNLYVYLVGNPGIGKTRPISSARKFIKEIKDIKLGATSMTMAALVDHLAASKRTSVEVGTDPLEFNSLYIVADELSAFMDKWEMDLVAGLTTFYDSEPYSQIRRTSSIDIKIERPILNILCGTTPSSLIRTTPEPAWEQGYMSRVILVYSIERPLIDIFNAPQKDPPPEMIHDLKIVSSFRGEFGYSKEFAEIFHEWRKSGCPPEPSHPKLTGYVSRRVGHVIKLCMVSSADRTNSMFVEAIDFKRALGWLTEAEELMPRIFHGGNPGMDSTAIDEIFHFISSAGERGMPEYKVVNFARLHVQNAYNIDAVLKVMERSTLVRAISVDRNGQRVFVAKKGG